MLSWAKRYQSLPVPLALLAVALLSYGIWIPWLGLYGNDLPYLWYFHLLGPWGPGLFASVDRPVSGLYYAAIMSLLGEQPWLYHILLLALRWLSGLLLWWVMGIVWPDQKRQSALAALFFVVYPGFRQNPVALEFILHIGVLDLFLVSLGTMLLAVCQPERQARWLSLSALSAGGLFFLEYFIGLEILRPIFLWLVTRRAGLRGRRQAREILRAWLPALAVVVAFLVWRIFIFQGERYSLVLLETLRVAPLSGLVELARTAARDVTTSLVGAWRLVFQMPAGPRMLAAHFFLVAAAAAVVWFLIRRIQNPVEGSRFSGARAALGWGEMAVVIGLVTMLASGLVFWLTGIPVTLEFPWDRSTLSFMLGASLAAAGLFEMLISERYRLAGAVLLVGLAVGAHFQNALVYNQEWAKLQSFFWQLSWRAPSLEPGTLILFDVIPLNRYSDNDLTTVLNWTYAPEIHTREIPYKFFDLTLRMDPEHAGLPGLEKDLPVEHNHRGLFFATTTSHLLAVHYNPPGCLVLLDLQDGALPGLPDRLAAVLPLINPAQVRTDAPPSSPPWQLGAEPERGWCYFYQKASLARQKEDWGAVVELGEQAFEQGLHWNDPAELLPFIEGYANSGDVAKARDLSAHASAQPGLKLITCGVWKNVGKNQDRQVRNAADHMLAELNCAP